MYTNSWTDGTATGTLNAVNLGLGTPISSDSAGAFNHFTFRWDATAVIPSTGVYPFSITLGGGGTLAVYATLVVVYSNPANPNQQVIINDGAEILQNAGSTTVFNGVGAGAGTLDILIGSGDTAGTGSEEIRYNGATLAGPDNIFNCNIGCFADVFSFAVPTTSGANTADIITGNDFIVWPLAILTAPSAIVIGGEMIPIDTTALLLASVQSISMWMIPVVVAGIGIAIGVFVIKRRK